MTKEQILDKHLKTLIENDKDAWFKFEEMKTMPEYKAVLNAMTELETELVKNNAVLPHVSNNEAYLNCDYDLNVKVPFKTKRYRIKVISEVAVCAVCAKKFEKTTKRQNICMECERNQTDC